ncbi:hypothetical protein N7541_008445, partial [Penicillium brevicompactum]
MDGMREVNNTSAAGSNGVDQQRPFPCDQCSKLFTRSENLQRHKRARHSGPSRKNFTCSRCHAQFSRRSCFRSPAHCNRGTPAARESQPQVPWEPMQ